MNKILILSRKELRGFFDSLTAYALLVVFLGLSGFFTWLFGSTVFFIKQASLQVFFEISYWTLFFVIPALTMRSLAEERRTGTLELLCTKAISDWEIILGKFLSCFLLVGFALLSTLPYYITVSMLGDVDHGATLGGYAGLLLLSASYIALGIFASSLTQNQFVSFLIALCIGSFFYILFGYMSHELPGILGSLFQFLSARVHYASLARGVIDTRDLIYFLSVIVLWLYLAKATLSQRK